MSLPGPTNNDPNQQTTNNPLIHWYLTTVDRQTRLVDILGVLDQSRTSLTPVCQMPVYSLTNKPDEQVEDLTKRVNNLKFA